MVALVFGVQGKRNTVTICTMKEDLLSSVAKATAICTMVQIRTKHADSVSSLTTRSATGPQARIGATPKDLTKLSSKCIAMSSTVPMGATHKDIVSS